jgi:hypothetical protein
MAEGVYTTEYRLLDTRIGRWLSVDPLFGKYAGMSSYNYCAGNPIINFDPDGKRVQTSDVNQSSAALDDVFENLRDVRNLFSFNQNELVYDRTNRSPAEKSAKQYFNSLSISQEEKEDRMSALTCLLDMMEATISNPKIINNSFGETEKGGGEFKPNGPLDLNNPGGGEAVVDPNGLFLVNVVQRGSLIEFKAVSSVGERYLHEIFGHGGSYINKWAGAEDANSIQTSNLYHRIKGDNLLRTGSDHEGFFLQDPSVICDTYYWPKAIDQNPNLKKPTYNNAQDQYKDVKEK